MAVINQKEYLKKYLNTGGDKDKRKKKKKKANIIKDRLKIIDDDIDGFNSENLTANELDEILTAEDAPQVVGVIDDRPLALRLDDYRKSSKWKLVGSDDEQDTIKKLEPHLNISDLSKQKLSKNKGYDSDLSPVRGKKDDSGSDMSPPRRGKNSAHIKDSDPSPRRKDRFDKSPQRIEKVLHRSHVSSKDSLQKDRKQSYSDSNPPRNQSPPRNARKKSRWNSENSPQHYIKKESRSDLEVSPLQGKNQYSDSDVSPPRKSQNIEQEKSYHKSENASYYIGKGQLSGHKRRSRTNSDCDRSPPSKLNKKDYFEEKRKYKSSYSSNERSHKNRYNSDSDISPSRKNNKINFGEKLNRKSESSSYHDNKYHSKQSDYKRYKHHREDRSEQYRNEKEFLQKKKRDSSLEPSTSKKMGKTLDGKTAGLQNAKDLKQETTDFKKREDELFKKMSEEVSGMNAAPVIRDRKTGKKRDFEKEEMEQFDKMKKEQEQKRKYDQWGKGLKQVDEHKEKLEQDLHEMNKPLARYADDEDLEKYLKDQERDGDPMLQYIRKKKRKEAVASGKPMKPVYVGEFMPNRFGIPPGHRWDGVDRSNGYEKSWFTKENAKKAVEEEVYKWSTEDM